MTPNDRFAALWNDGPAPDVFHFLDEYPNLPPPEQAEVIMTDQYHRWRTGQALLVADYLRRRPALVAQGDVVRALTRHEDECRRETEAPVPSHRPAQSLDLVLKRAADHPFVNDATHVPAGANSAAASPVARNEEPALLAAAPKPRPALATLATEPPRRVGRYRVDGLLGAGSFGTVWLALDPDLDRRVAVKIPHHDEFPSAAVVERFLNEARSAGRLRHPGIVTVHDVGRAESGPFVVMEYVQGRSLDQIMTTERLPVERIVEISACIAEALAHAHQNGIVHRDLKPANVLVDARGLPRVCDFGMALHESLQHRHRGEVAGSAAYMAPEQTRGESHRLDGRTDIWALGVILYELLTGRRPFSGENRAQLLDEIQHRDPVPPRQIDSATPAELARITLRCLAKRMTDRFETAIDLAGELRSWLTPPEWHPVRPLPAPAACTEGNEPVGVPVVPQGLRSFTGQEAMFFLELLPGARDRDGLPESIRFWRSRIETTERDATFSVGLIYGPSGCGKTSLMDAGLLPRLSRQIQVVRVDATPQSTEDQLLRALRRRCPWLPPDRPLVDVLRDLREGNGLSAGEKFLIVIDQLEQWLHAHPELEQTQLVESLRQCDGGRLQAILMVRDDFWMATTRLMRALEIRVVEGRNSAAVDLFDPLHARKVLRAFGQAYGRIDGEIDNSQRSAFLDQAVAALATDGKIVCVRLALFAQMIKGRPWTTATLRAVGGMDGVGTTFLEETFSAPTAPPEHKRHALAARKVLSALLPEHGRDIKGHVRSDVELRAAACYDRQPREFEELLRILDGELRLITPSDPAGAPAETHGLERAAGSDAKPAERCYQLTHDYLVPSLREWVTRRQRATRRGRAELKLKERAALWNSRPEACRLPAWWEHLWIVAHTRQADRSPGERRMIRASSWFHAVRGLTALSVVCLSAWFFMHQRAVENWRRAAEAEAQAVRMFGESVPGADLKELESRLASPHVQRAAAALRARFGASSRSEKLRIALVLARIDPDCRRHLFDTLLNDSSPEEFRTISRVLARLDGDPQRIAICREEAQKEPRSTQRWFRAACFLVTRPEADDRWKPLAADVAAALVRAEPSELSEWCEILQPARGALRSPLLEILRNPSLDPRTPGGEWIWSDSDAQSRWTEQERNFAALAVKEFRYGGHELLDALLEADEPRFRILFAAFQPHLPRYAGDLERIAAQAVDAAEQAPPEAAGLAVWNDFYRERERLARRRANAYVARVLWKDEWFDQTVLSARSDQRTRSWLIHRFAPLGVPLGRLLKEFQSAQETSVRFNLLLAIGNYPPDAVGAEERTRLRSQLAEISASHPDAGLHAAAQWALRKWSPGSATQENQPVEPPPSGRRWWQDRLGQTFVRIDADGVFPFWALSTESTRRQFDRFVQDMRQEGEAGALPYQPDENEVRWTYANAPEIPAAFVSFHMAARYCNWLSARNGVPEDQWCYEHDGTLPDGGLRMRPVADWQERTGFRLPTVREWQLAAAAGSPRSMRRHYGDSDELLAQYAHYSRNTNEEGYKPVAMLMPNEWGLFDMLGNVFEWSHDTDETSKTCLLGGAFCIPARVVVSSKREEFAPTHADYRAGFRPVRSIRDAN